MADSWLEFSSDDAWRLWSDPLWVVWYAERAAIAASREDYLQRGWRPGMPLEYQVPRPTRDRSHLAYSKWHSSPALRGQPMAPKPGRVGGFVWLSNTCPHARLQPFRDGLGGGLVWVTPALQDLAQRNAGRVINLPSLADLRGTSSEARARLLLGERLGPTQLVHSRAALIDLLQPMATDDLSPRGRAWVAERDAELAAAQGGRP